MAQYPWEEVPKEYVNSYLSLLPQFVIAFCLEFTRNYAFYTWLQASFFLWSILSFVRHFFGGVWRALAGALLLVSPLILGYSVFWEMGAVAAACLLWLLILEDMLSGSGRTQARWLRWMLWILYGTAAFFMVGYRLNAGTAVVGLAVWGAVHTWRRDKSLRGWLPQLLAAGLGIVLAFGLPEWLGLHGKSNSVVGFAWESACMLSEIGEGQGYDTCLDDVFGEGGTRKIMAVPLEEGIGSMYAYMSDSGVDFFQAANPGAREKVYKCFLQLVRSHPGMYFRMDGYNFSDTLRRQQFHQLVNSYMETNEWLRTPWLLFAVSAVLGALQYAVSGSKMPLKLLWTAFWFESAFFITTQSYEFRYFFPACLLLLFACLLSLQVLVPAALCWLRTKRHGGGAASD